MQYEKSISDRLLQEGNYVICLDNLFTGRTENIRHLMDNSKFQLLVHDVTEPLDLEVERIYNLACPASPVHYQADPIKTAKTSVLGTLILLDLAERNGARILQASASEVYGDLQVHPQTETYRGCVNLIGIRV